MENAITNIGEAFFGTYVGGSGFTGINGGFAFPLLGVICYMTGLLIGFQSLVKAARASQSHGGGEKSVWTGPIVGFLIAGAMVAIPQTVMDLNATVFSGTAQNKIMAYGGNKIAGLSFGSKTDQVIQTLVLFIQFIGWISIFRGFMMLKRAADGGNQSYAVGITHILGGVLSANVMAFADAMQDTICKSKCLFNVI
jgi:hypothetical protein